ncbi:uncharacterized protein J4E92_002657 [Alternaria infectoria]|uniref:uncharacterized protein n=1 Tax=Alternaria infectoria TaxID=45303 RepID=UPI0022200EBB|nr:uncharacterized protein J4E92_002657 [Alternaria infectoria]KAI4935369.1 hypothetical protein J4E92_002657 [Alternaria infectoria]
MQSPKSKTAMPTLADTPTPAPKGATKRKAEVVIDLENMPDKREVKPFRPVSKTPEEKEEEAFFQVSVTANAKFDKIPIALRNKLEAACQTAFYKHMFSLKAGTMPEYRQQYDVCLGLRTRTLSMKFETTVAVPNVLDLSMANAALLDYFTKCFKGTHRLLTKEACVELKSQGGLLNPEFIELYAVRHGELGWGFDAGGCLSLYITSVTDHRLKEKVLYVKAGGVKLKEED